MVKEMSAPTNINYIHILIIPFPAAGHILPLMDLTHQLAIRGGSGFSFTIMVTPKNLGYLNPLLSLHPSIKSLVFPFPSHPSFPDGVEQLLEVQSMPDIVTALGQLHDPILNWSQNNPSPPCVILSDMLLCPWTHRLALQMGVKDIAYNAVSTHALYCWFVELRESRDFDKEMYLATKECWGVVSNSFSHYDGKYLELIKAELVNHDRVWNVGPLLPLESSSKSTFGSSNEILEWLDSCPDDGSVVYIAFGSQITLSRQQMEAIANALVESGVKFIWVIKDSMEGGEVVPSGTGDHRSTIPEGFEDHVAGNGLVVRGWVPQVAILKHRAVGSFLNHFGWNSLVEGILTQVLMLVWPMQVDHFFNAKLLVDEMGVAIRVCEGLDTIPDTKKLAQILKHSVSRSLPERIKAMEWHRKALDAIEEGGTSYKALDEMVSEVSNLK